MDRIGLIIVTPLKIKPCLANVLVISSNILRWFLGFQIYPSPPLLSSSPTLYRSIVQPVILGCRIKPNIWLKIYDCCYWSATEDLWLLLLKCISSFPGLSLSRLPFILPIYLIPVIQALSFSSLSIQDGNNWHIKQDPPSFSILH